MAGPGCDGDEDRWTLGSRGSRAPGRTALNLADSQSLLARSGVRVGLISRPSREALRPGLAGACGVGRRRASWLNTGERRDSLPALESTPLQNPVFSSFLIHAVRRCRKSFINPISAA